jgi:hypothetical protein
MRTFYDLPVPFLRRVGRNVHDDQHENKGGAAVDLYSCLGVTSCLVANRLI